MADFEEAGDDDVMRKVVKDLAGKGVTEQAGARQDERVARWRKPSTAESQGGVKKQRA